MLAHKISTLFFFSQIFIASLIVFNGSSPESAILPAKIEIIESTFVFTELYISLTWLRVNTAVTLHFTLLFDRLFINLIVFSPFEFVIGIFT